MSTFFFILIVCVAWWAISIAVTRGKDFLRSRERREAARRKWGNRLKERSGTLEDRNENIIRSHLERLDVGSHRPHYLDDSVRNCIQEIAEAEGRLSEAPNLAYLYKWSQNASPDLQSLAGSLKPRFHSRLEELSRLEREQQGRETEAKMHALEAKYTALIAAFYEVAERKVSLRDDYGDERWDALDREIIRVLSKIATAEGCGDVSQWKKYEFLMPEEYKRLSTFIAQSFKERHQSRETDGLKAEDCSSMSGVEFEVFVTKLLRQLGLTDIRSTPATNDQGADVLATKEGKTIVVQAKRYAGPVGNSAVQEVISAMHFYSGDEGWVVTNSTFTQSAKELAQKAGIRLIDGHELVDLSIGK